MYEWGCWLLAVELLAVLWVLWRLVTLLGRIQHGIPGLFAIHGDLEALRQAVTTLGDEARQTNTRQDEANQTHKRLEERLIGVIQAISQQGRAFELMDQMLQERHRQPPTSSKEP